MTTSEPADNTNDANGDSEIKMADKLPEGFFDDPVKDAKVAHVITSSTSIITHYIDLRMILIDQC